MKMETTKRVAQSVRKQAVTAWTKWWKNLSQKRIQQWISRIIRHIQAVILLEGDNKYKDSPIQKGEVLGETGEWVDLGAFDPHLLETS